MTALRRKPQICTCSCPLTDKNAQRMSSRPCWQMQGFAWSGLSKSLLVSLSLRRHQFNFFLRYSNDVKCSRQDMPAGERLAHFGGWRRQGTALTSPGHVRSLPHEQDTNSADTAYEIVCLRILDF